MEWQVQGEGGFRFGVSDWVEGGQWRWFDGEVELVRAEVEAAVTDARDGRRGGYL